MKRKIISILILVIVLVSLFTGCTEKTTTESNNQKPPKSVMPTHKIPTLPNRDGAIENAASISDKGSQIGQEHNAHMDQLAKDITDRNTEIEQWSNKHNARIDQFNNDIADRNAEIEQWSNEHNVRINALEGDIAAQNAEMYEASIKAIEHVNELNQLTNDCLNDLLHMYANIGLGLCGIPGSILSITITPYEFKNTQIKYLSYVPGSISTIQMALSGQFRIVSVSVGTIIGTELDVKNVNRISQKVDDIGKRSNRITFDLENNINDQVIHINELCDEYNEIASKKSKSIEDTERMNELVVDLTYQNNRIEEYLQDYNDQTNELVAEINQLIVDEMKT